MKSERILKQLETKFGAEADIVHSAKDCPCAWGARFLEQLGCAGIKANALHGFKGWDSRLLVVHVGHAVGDDSLALVYAALTLLKHSPSGRWLSVVCSAPELAEFGRTWLKHQFVAESTFRSEGDNP